MTQGMQSLDDELKNSMITVFFPTFLKIIIPLIVLILVFTVLKMFVKSHMRKGWAFVVCMLLNVVFFASTYVLVMYIVKNVKLPDAPTEEISQSFMLPHDDYWDFLD